MSKIDNPQPETLNHDESIFTDEERAAFATFMELHGLTADPEEIADGNMIELSEICAKHLDNPLLEDINRQIITQAIQKSEHALMEMQENVAKLSCQIPALDEGDKIKQYLEKFQRERSRYPFKIRAQMAAMTIDTFINDDERIIAPEIDKDDSKQLVILMETYIAAIIFSSKRAGLPILFKKLTEKSAEEHEQLFQAIRKMEGDFQMSGTVGNQDLNRFVQKLREELLVKGIIQEKSETEVKRSIRVQLTVVLQNQKRIKTS